MARMEMDFNFCSCVSVKKEKVIWLVFFFFQNSFDFVFLVVWKQFMHEQGGTSI